jgi:hypothetical protein
VCTEWFFHAQGVFNIKYIVNVTVTAGKTHDATVGRTLKFSKGSIVAADKGRNVGGVTLV